LWAHNSHLGDARATEMGRQGEWNVGQLVRERHGREAVLIGFTTYTGTVHSRFRLGRGSGAEKSSPGNARQLRGAVPTMREYRPSCYRFRGYASVEGLAETMWERAIGVIYRPESELASHYFHARLSDQFDAVIHVDQTRAVEPLEPTSEWGIGETGGNVSFRGCRRNVWNQLRQPAQ